MAAIGGDKTSSARRQRRRYGLLVGACASFLAFALLGAGCGLRSAVQPSILVVLVENLGFASLSCSEDESLGESSGFQVLCDEAVRFTHAYTPSVMSQAAVASILTGQLPQEIGVRHNGPQTFPAARETVAEAAISKSFRTIFFSSGPPIFRRGLNQGFESFDDNIALNAKKLYRPAQELVDGFLGWQKQEAARDRFLAFIYLGDLQFPTVPTLNDLGEIRESSFQSQLEEIDESLGTLFREMKTKKIWDSTDVFVVGLGGAAPVAFTERAGEMQPTNLFGESTHAALMIKPAGKRREGPFNWKIDINVSLVDVGTTLFDLVVGRLPEGLSRSSSAGVSLQSALKGPAPNWAHDRSITSESAWADWRGVGGIRGAVRRESYLYVLDEPDSIYNTLTDNFEYSPLPLGDERSYQTRMQLSESLRNQGYQSWQAPSRSTVEKLALARDLWRRKEIDAETLSRLRNLALRFSKDEELAGWRAVLALRRSDWVELKETAGKESVRAEWAFVAARNLGEKANVPASPCFDFLKERPSERKLSRDCSSSGVRELFDWTNEALPESERTKAFEALLRIQSQKALANTLAEHNVANGWVWDVPIDGLSVPDPVELILALPEMRKYRNQLRTKLGG